MLATFGYMGKHLYYWTCWCCFWSNFSFTKLDDPPAMAAGIAGAFTATVMGIAGSYIYFLGPWELN